MRASFVRAVSFFLAAVLGLWAAAVAVPADGAEKTAGPPVIVIGFVGGLVRHDNLAHSGVQMAARLRSEYVSAHVEVFENRRGEIAHEQVLRLLDTNQDGHLSPEENRNARSAIYAISWGGSETVTLARELEKDAVPVLLTIQVDSVRKTGEDDTVM